MKNLITLLAAFFSVTILGTSDTISELEAKAIDLSLINNYSKKEQSRIIIDLSNDKVGLSVDELIEDDDLRLRLIEDIVFSTTGQPCGICQNN